jgi:enamine deaminase RidA (YjgF/YER057c/UK114 family)
MHATPFYFAYRHLINDFFGFMRNGKKSIVKWGAMDAFTLFALGAGTDQLHITARIDGQNQPAAATAEKIWADVALTLDSCGMRILSERVFGTLDFYESYRRIRGKHRNFVRGPFSYIQGNPVRGQGLGGIQIHAVKPVSDENPRVLYDGNRPCGSVWKRKETTYLHFAGVHGLQEALRNGDRSRRDQAASMFESMKRLLASQSTGFRDVVRTWIYLDDILEWYGAFNAARTEKFKSFGLIPGSVEEPDGNHVFLPASTGVGGRNPAGAFCCGDVLAVTGADRVSVLPATLQPSAYSYGSAFSRGICVEEKEYRQVFVSGTAAIDASGRSLYPRDAESQISTTLEVVKALIGEKGAGFEDIRSATVYFKKAGDWSAYEKVARRLGLMHLPAVFVVADICRDELLFEMDALAVID